MSVDKTLHKYSVIILKLLIKLFINTISHQQFSPAISGLSAMRIIRSARYLELENSERVTFVSNFETAIRDKPESKRQIVTPLRAD